MELFTQEVMQAVIDLLGKLFIVALPVITGRIAIWVKGRFSEIVAAQPENVRKAIESAIEFGADFAEQMDFHDRLTEYASDKKDLALQKARDFLALQGYQGIDTSILDAALEAWLRRNPNRYPSSMGEK